MPIGRRSPRKRPRNDLDDYLDEVDSRLFCVTKADRQCLHRDLKAHVKAITTDPSSRDRFEGMYQISMAQLNEEIGNPKTIAMNYIASVACRIPSIGLKIFMTIMAFVFLLSLIIGFDRIFISTHEGVPGADWLKQSGLGLSLVAIGALLVLSVSVWKFERFHKFLAYLLIFFTVLSFPCSIYLARGMTRTMYKIAALEIQDFYGLLFIIDIMALGLIGVYVYLNHYRVLETKEELIV